MTTLTAPARPLLTQAPPSSNPGLATSEPASLDTELDDYLFPESQYPVPSQSTPDHQPGFVIDDIAKATWAARRIAQASARIASRQALAKAYKDRIDAWLASSSSPDESTIDYLSSLLRPYVEQVLAGSKRRTIRLFEVDVSLRKRPDRLELWDESEALSYCDTHHPALVITTKALSKSDLKSLLTTGLVVPGASLAPGMDDLVVKAHGE